MPDPGTEEGPTEATITTNLDGIVTRWEDDAHALYGRSAHEVVGLPIERAVGASLDSADVARAGKREFTTHYDAAGGPLPVRMLVIRTAAESVIVCETVDSGERVAQRLQSVLDLLHDGVVIMNPDGRFQFTNRAARQACASTSSTVPFLAQILGPDSGTRQRRRYTSASIRNVAVTLRRREPEPSRCGSRILGDTETVTHRQKCGGERVLGRRPSH